MSFISLPFTRQPHAARLRKRRGLRGPWTTCLPRMVAPALRVAACAAVGATLAACGAPGDPTPRRPLTPQPVTDLTARQQGDAVVLTFTLPRYSTDQEPLPAPPAVEIYRGSPSPGAPPTQPSTRLVHTIPGSLADTYEVDGRFEFRDPLDPGEIAGAPGDQLLYLVRTRASAKRASAESNMIAVPVYPAPETIRDLRATSTEEAIALAWSAPEHTTAGATLADAPAYRVYRAELTPGAAAAAEETTPEARLRPPLQLLGQAFVAEHHDTTSEFGLTYLYSVRSVVQFGPDSVESADSNLVMLTAQDVFPLAAPQALVAVFAPAVAEESAYIDLTWAISTEPDLAGYAVYRSVQPDMPGERLTRELLLTPVFRDASILPGRRYFYRVLAVDRAGNQSSLSDAVTVEPPNSGPQ